MGRKGGARLSPCVCREEEEEWEGEEEGKEEEQQRLSTPAGPAREVFEDH